MREEIFKHIRTHFREMEGYSSAGMEAGKSGDIIYLNANENPYELPGLEGLNRYPEPQPLVLREAFAQNYGVENDQVLITRGADEALVLLTKAFCEPHQDNILISSPAFGMYAVDAHAMPAGVVDVPLIKSGNTFDLDKDGIIAAATNPENKIKIVYICSPNNPTATSFDHEMISEICEALEGHCVVVLDEAYAEFSRQGSMCPDLDSTPNLIILRTLSKAFAFAGMRVGCMLCGDADFIDLMYVKLLDAYPLPRLSIEAAFHALSPEVKEIAMQSVEKLLSERERMEAEFAKIDFVTCIYQSDANFLLLGMKDAKGFCDFAKKNKVIIRDFSSKKGTENCLRLSIGLPEENDLVLELLKKYIA